MITNIRKNIMATVSFDGKFPKMRKAQDFIVYPMNEATTTVEIQSDNRFGRINLDTGEIVVSAASGGHSSSITLALSEMRGTAVRFCLPTPDRVALREAIKATGGALVGGVVKSDNSGAMAL